MVAGSNPAAGSTLRPDVTVGASGGAATHCVTLPPEVPERNRSNNYVPRQPHQVRVHGLQEPQLSLDQEQEDAQEPLGAQEVLQALQDEHGSQGNEITLGYWS
jgi:hypothetical protein